MKRERNVTYIYTEGKDDLVFKCPQDSFTISIEDCAKQPWFNLEDVLCPCCGRPMELIQCNSSSINSIIKDLVKNKWLVKCDSGKYKFNVKPTYDPEHLKDFKLSIKYLEFLKDFRKYISKYKTLAKCFDACHAIWFDGYGKCPLIIKVPLYFKVSQNHINVEDFAITNFEGSFKTILKMLPYFNCSSLKKGIGWHLEECSRYLKHTQSYFRFYTKLLKYFEEDK